MEKKNETMIKLAQTALVAALCYVTFTFLQIKIPMPGGDAGGSVRVLGRENFILSVKNVYGTDS